MEVPFFYARTNQNPRRTGLYYSPFPILPSTTDADGQHTRRYADGASKAGHCRPHSLSPSAHGSLSSSPARSFSDLPPHLLSCLPLSSRIYWPGASVILATQRGYALGCVSSLGDASGPVRNVYEEASSPEAE